MAAKKQEKSTANMGAELIGALNQIAREKGISEDLIFETIEASLVSACKKNFGTSQNIKVTIDRKSGEISVYAQKLVTENPEDDFLEISIDEARNIKPDYNIGDIVDISVIPKDFGRIAAMAAKQVVVQKFKEAERDILYNEYITKEREIVTGIVQRKEKRNYIIALGKVDATLLPSEQIPGEELIFQSRIKVYITEVKQTTKGPVIGVSRTHPELVKRLFEQEIPEVYDGIVEIKSISREAGSRTKIAVSSNREGVDPVGACVGPNGGRVNIIVAELHGEKVDIIKYSSNPQEYIASALSPSKAVEVITDEESMTAKVIVPDHQLSLAIGKEGQNVRLAAKLTGWRIDIRSESQSRQLEFDGDDDDDYDNYDDDYDNDDNGYGDDYGDEDGYGDDYGDEDGYDDDYGDEDGYDDDEYNDGEGTAQSDEYDSGSENEK